MTLQNDDIGALNLGDIIDAPALQAMMDDFYRLTRIGCAVVDLSGQVLVAVGWQEVCTRFHRVHPETLKNCMESDVFLSNGVPAGTFKTYRCKNNMWDIATPIKVGDRHLGNLFLGQFFFADEVPDDSLFRLQARQYGFDEETYLETLHRVPRWSRETIDAVMSFYAKLAGMISSLGYSTVRLARVLAQQETALQQLANSEERFRLLSDLTLEGVLIHRQGIVKDLNASLAKLIGYSREEMIGQNILALAVHQEDRHIVRENIIKDYARPYIVRVVRKNGESFYAELEARNFQLKDEMLRVAAVRDVTERIEAQETNRQLEAKLHQAQKMKAMGRMAGAVAHHFNNQLAVVQGNLELALDDLPAREDTRRLLTEAMLAASRSSEISTLMLTYLGQSGGKGEPLDLSAVCRRQVPLLREALSEGIALETDFMDVGPVVRGAAHQIHQVLTHLIANAAEAIGDRGGKVILATRTIPAAEIPKSHLAQVDWQPASDTYACLEVADTGCGINPDDMNKIFDPFFTTKFTGRGLGLAVVMGIVKAYDGAVGVESTLDEGSTFRVYWPLAPDAVPRRSPSAIPARETEKVGTVLLVEDQAPVRKMAEAMLGRLGYAVIEAADGPEALELFGRHRDTIGCAITDLTMPGMDGWQVLAALRKLQPALPVILSSGYDETKAMGREDGEQPDAFLHKPYSKGELKEAIEKAWK